MRQPDRSGHGVASVEGWTRIEPGVIQARYRSHDANAPLRQIVAWCEWTMSVGLSPAPHRCSGNGKVNRVRESSARPMKGQAGGSGASSSELTMGRDHRATRAADLAPRTTDHASDAREGAELVRPCNRLARESTRGGGQRY